MHDKWQSVNPGEVQVMSAGTGVQHSEINGSNEEYLSLFQIWIVPNEKDVAQRYDQKFFEDADRINELQILVTSVDDDHEGSLKIHQNARLSRIDLKENSTFEYNLLSKDHGVYVMNISGEIQIDKDISKTRDAIGVNETDKFEVKAKEGSQLLFIEVPMI